MIFQILRCDVPGYAFDVTENIEINVLLKLMDSRVTSSPATLHFIPGKHTNADSCNK